MRCHRVRDSNGWRPRASSRASDETNVGEQPEMVSIERWLASAVTVSPMRLKVASILYHEMD